MFGVLLLAYGALVVFLGWLVLWHLLQSLVTFKDGPYFIFHAPMLALGALLLGVLIKPILFRQKTDEDQTLTLDPSKYAALYAFVHALCDATDKPRPTRIEVDCVPNAAARFDGGIVAMLRGQFVLRLGLPLLATFTAQELAGVICHELAHFSQRGGLTSSHFVRSMTLFLARVIFARDRIDERLWRLRHGNAFAQLFYWITFGFVEAARGVILLMLLSGDMMCKRAMRKMEFAADRLEARVSGNACFEQTSILIAMLDLASRRTESDLAATWDEQRLPDDMPALTAANVEALQKHRDKVIELLRGLKTRWFDTHPCHNDRCAAAATLPAEGAFTCDEPASVLVNDFGGLCREITLRYYKRVLGKKFDAAKLVDSAQINTQRQRDRTAGESLQRYFYGCQAWSSPVSPGADWHTPVSDRAAAAEQLFAARQALRDLCTQSNGLGNDLTGAAAETFVFDSQIKLASIFPGSDDAYRFKRTATEKLGEAKLKLETSSRCYAKFAEVAQPRITLALRLLHTDGVDLPDADAMRARVAARMDVLDRILPSLESVRTLHQRTIALRVHGEMILPGEPISYALENAVLGLMSQVRESLAYLRDQLTHVPYPFEHAIAGISVGASLMDKIPEENDPFLVHNVAMEAIDRHVTTTARLLADVAEVAEKVEAHLGLPVDELPETKPDPAVTQEQELLEQKESRRVWLGYSARAAAGLALVTGLVWLSVSPPVLPAMSWQSESTGGYAFNYRPASFSGSWSPQRSASPVVYLPDRGYSPVVMTQTGPMVVSPNTGVRDYSSPQFGSVRLTERYQPPMVDARQYLPPDRRTPTYPGGSRYAPQPDPWNPSPNAPRTPGWQQPGRPGYPQPGHPQPGQPSSPQPGGAPSPGGSRR